MSTHLPPDERRRLAEATREACIRAALEGYETAAMSGLCHEGAWENAISAIRQVDLDPIIAAALAHASFQSRAHR